MTDSTNRTKKSKVDQQKERHDQLVGSFVESTIANYLVRMANPQPQDKLLIDSPEDSALTRLVRSTLQNQLNSPGAVVDATKNCVWATEIDSRDQCYANAFDLIISDSKLSPRIDLQPEEAMLQSILNFTSYLAPQGVACISMPCSKPDKTVKYLFSNLEKHFPDLQNHLQIEYRSNRLGKGKYQNIFFRLRKISPEIAQKQSSQLLLPFKVDFGVSSNKQACDLSHILGIDSNQQQTNPLKEGLREWNQLDKKGYERSYQDLFNRWPELLEAVIPRPVKVLREQSYVGGKFIDDCGGGRTDFVFVNEVTRNVVLVEIKRPDTDLVVWDEEKKIYRISLKLKSAVEQLKTYLEKFNREYGKSIKEYDGETFRSYAKEGLLIIGSVNDGANKSLHEAQIRLFEKYRNKQKHIQISTFDEVRRKVEQAQSKLEPNYPPDALNNN